MVFLYVVDQWLL